MEGSDKVLNQDGNDEQSEASESGRTSKSKSETKQAPAPARETAKQDENKANTTTVPVEGENITQLQKDVDSKTTDIVEMEKKIAFWQDDRLGYFSLLDKCLEKKLDKYLYKICFFKDA